MKAVAFAKLLRKDLEVSAEFELKSGAGELLSRLQATGHVKVVNNKEAGTKQLGSNMVANNAVVIPVRNNLAMQTSLAVSSCSIPNQSILACKCSILLILNVLPLNSN